MYVSNEEVHSIRYFVAHLFFAHIADGTLCLVETFSLVCPVLVEEVLLTVIFSRDELLDEDENHD